MAISSAWLSFLDGALWGLAAAGERLREDACRERYQDRPGWFRRPMRVGGQEGVGVPDETSVSQALESLFEEIVSEQLISGLGDRDRDLRHYWIATERQRASGLGVGPRSKPTDLAISLRADGSYDLRIEAKTVLTEADIAAAYLSANGLGRFEDDAEPYTVEPVGGMIAYVVDGTATDWGRRILDGLHRSLGAARLASTTIGDSDVVTSLHAAPDHPRAGSDLRVLHLVFQVDARPDLRR